MGLFKKNTQQLSERQQLESRYNSARINILWVLIFTIVNIVLLLAGKYTYFVFSAFIPYVLMVYGMDVTGKMPPDYYELDMRMYDFADPSILTTVGVIVAAICGLYLLCWLLSKNGKVGWLIVAMVMFVLDTIFMFSNGIPTDSVLDVVFHIWVIVSFGMGIYAHFKLKKLPPEAPTGPDIVE